MDILKKRDRDRDRNRNRNRTRNKNRNRNTQITQSKKIKNKTVLSKNNYKNYMREKKKNLIDTLKSL